MYKLLNHSFWKFSEAISKWILKSHVYSLSYKFIDSFIDLMRDEPLTEMDKSHKRRRDDQDPPYPLPDSDFKPAWVIPSSHIPNAENNWANALATTYQASPENSLLGKTGDMQTFIHWYCQHIGKTKLTQADFEGQAYEVVKSFYPDVVHFQFQMKECHKMLTDQIDWANPEGWDAKGFEYKHDYIIIDSPRAVVFPVGNNERKIMRFNEIYKFSDGTLINIMEALDFRVKEYKCDLFQVVVPVAREGLYANNTEYTYVSSDYLAA
nr:hypothetical protein [Tanacetum cinerariifolium]